MKRRLSIKSLRVPPLAGRGNLFKYVLLIISSIASVLIIYPSAFIYSKDTLPDNNDTRLIAYIIGQVQQNILQRQPLFYGTFFAPDQNTLTYSDPFITSSLITLPFRLFTDHPIQIFNLASIIGTTLTILSSFLLFQHLFKNTWVAAFSAFLFNFSGYHLHYYPHLQIFSLWPMLLSIYFFLRFQNENKLFFLHLFFLTATAQLAESIFPFYLLFFTCFILLFHPSRRLLKGYANLQKGVSLTGMAQKIIFASFLYLPFWLALIFPYFQLHQKFPEATRPIRDAAHFSLGLEEIFIKYRSWTIALLFFVSTGIHATSRRLLKGYANPPKGVSLKDAPPWKTIFIFSLIMSLGPILKIFGQTIKIFNLPIPLPYSLFYYIFPGFTGFRTPSRFIILALLAATILVGFNLQPLFEKIEKNTQSFVIPAKAGIYINKILFLYILLIASLLFLEADLPLKAFPVNINRHPVYEQVKALPKEAVILELPIKLWNMPDHEIESVRSLYSLYHQHRRFGGFSDFASNAWIDLVEKINAYGLNEENITALKKLGVTHYIENNNLYSFILAVSP